MEQNNDSGIIIIIIFLCCCSSIIFGTGGYIYEEIYKDYSNIFILPKGHANISNFGELKDFVKYLIEKIIKWIKCKILGKFTERFKDTCNQGVLPLPVNLDIELNAADPGSLDAALRLLTIDQIRQREDFEWADKALDALRAAINAGSSIDIFNTSDDVQAWEMALGWRAWITAQTAEMTHNITNLEICDENGNLKDFMDLSATGRDTNNEQIIGPDGDKKGSDFRWSSRCESSFVGTFGEQLACTEPNIDDEDYGKYWVTEVLGPDMRNPGQGRADVTNTSIAFKAPKCCKTYTAVPGVSTRNSETCDANVEDAGCDKLVFSDISSDYNTMKRICEETKATTSTTGESCQFDQGSGGSTASTRLLVNNDLDSFGIGDFSGYNCQYYSEQYCSEGYPNYDEYPEQFGYSKNWPELNCCACGGGNLMHSGDKIKFEKLNKKCTDEHEEDHLVDYLKPDTQTNAPVVHTNAKEAIIYCKGDPSCKGIRAQRVNPPNPQAPSVKYKYNPIIDKPENPLAIDRILSRSEGRIDPDPAALAVCTTSYATPPTNNEFILKKMDSSFHNFYSDHSTIADDQGEVHTLPYDAPIKLLSGNTCDNLCGPNGILDNDYVLKKSYTPPCPSEGCKRSECCDLNTCNNSHKGGGEAAEALGKCDAGKIRDDKHNSYLCDTANCLGVPDKEKCCKIRSVKAADTPVLCKSAHIPGLGVSERENFEKQCGQYRIDHEATYKAQLKDKTYAIKDEFGSDVMAGANTPDGINASEFGIGCLQDHNYIGTAKIKTNLADYTWYLEGCYYDMPITCPPDFEDSDFNWRSEGAGRPLQGQGCDEVDYSGSYASLEECTGKFTDQNIGYYVTAAAGGGLRHAPVKHVYTSLFPTCRIKRGGSAIGTDNCRNGFMCGYHNFDPNIALTGGEEAGYPLRVTTSQTRVGAGLPACVGPRCLAISQATGEHHQDECGHITAETARGTYRASTAQYETSADPVDGTCEVAA